MNHTLLVLKKEEQLFQNPKSAIVHSVIKVKKMSLVLIFHLWMVMIDFIRVTTLRIPLMTHLHEYKMATKAYITKKNKKKKQCTFQYKTNIEFIRT